MARMEGLPTKQDYSSAHMRYDNDGAERAIQDAVKYIKKGYRVIVESTGGDELYQSQGFMRSNAPIHKVNGIDAKHFRYEGFGDQLDNATREAIEGGTYQQQRKTSKVKSANDDLFGDDQDMGLDRDGLESHDVEVPTRGFSGMRHK